MAVRPRYVVATSISARKIAAGGRDSSVGGTQVVSQILASAVSLIAAIQLEASNARNGRGLLVGGPAGFLVKPQAQ